MKLSHLTQSLTSLTVKGPDRQTADPDIRAVHYDSRSVEPGGLFVAIKGLASDGHEFVTDAIARGAAAVVVEDEITGSSVPSYRVRDSRKALALLGDTFYGHPSKAMHITGITGTNGKTSITYLLEAIYKEAGLAAGVIGTINYRYAGKEYPNPMTTPESLDLQRILSDMKQAGITHVIMEVSSHAVSLDRIYAIAFNSGVFTNLSQDHLDYHGTMDRYFDCKKRFFTDFLANHDLRGRDVRAVINIAQDHGRDLMNDLTVPVYTTCADASDIRLSDAALNIDGIRGTLVCPEGSTSIISEAIGTHNVENILNAAGAALCAGVPLSAIPAGVRQFRVPGRLERVNKKQKFHVFVDYAHTPDGLLNVLRTLKPLTPGRLITVFGCGGDRDRTKRPKMGGIAEEWSDLCIVTSDNPRTEDPDGIIKDILQGMNAKTHLIESDRKTAINTAVSLAEAGDSILIAGKGHETYQILNTGTIDFDDRTEARKALELCES